MLCEPRPGSQTSEVCRRHKISEQTFCHWKSKYGGMGPSAAARLKGIEDEDLRLKNLLAEPILDNAVRRDLLSEN